MRPKQTPNPNLAARLAELAAQVEAIECGSGGGGREDPGNGQRGVVATGWGTLRRGAVHEWFGVAARDDQNDEKWSPPLCILGHLAWQALSDTNDRGNSRRCVVWIGRCVWPYPHVLLRGDREETRGWQLLRRSLFIDPPDDASRLWAIDLAVRCPAVTAVIADGRRLSMAASRRLQLAAESAHGKQVEEAGGGGGAGGGEGGPLVILARPPQEGKELSVAATRWWVAPASSATGRPRWNVTLLRCKRSRASGSSSHEADRRNRYERNAGMNPQPGMCMRSGDATGSSQVLDLKDPRARGARVGPEGRTERSTQRSRPGFWSGIMPRALSLHFPMWSIDLVRRRRGQRRRGQQRRGQRPGRRDAPGMSSPPGPREESPDTLLLVLAHAGTQRVVRRCEHAAAAGVRPDMTLAQARALLVDDVVRVEPFDETRDHRALTALASWSLRFTPVVGSDPPDGLLLNIHGCERLYHGERRLVNIVANSLEWLGFAVRAATATTYGAAWAVARYGERERTIVEAGRERLTLAPLPVEALRIAPETAAALREVNLDRIGHLLELPRPELATRFGPDLLLRLDQAFGRREETIEPIRPVEPPWIDREFDGPVTQLEAITETVRELIDELTQRLHRAESGARQLDLVCARIDAAPVHLTIELSRPSRDARHLWSLLRPRVEMIHLGFGIERLTLTATKAGRLRHEQGESWRIGGGGRGGHPGDGEARGDAGLERSFGEFVDTLAGRLGTQRTVRIEPVESHVPERAFRRASMPIGSLSAAPPGRPRGGGDATATMSERPSVLFTCPEPIEVIAMTPDGPPSWMRWRETATTIVSAFGPERIAGEWWDSNWARTRKQGSLPTRDYYKVQDEEGRWLWVYRVIGGGGGGGGGSGGGGENGRENGRWFAHGRWT